MGFERDEEDGCPVIVVLPGIDDGPDAWRLFCDIYPSVVLEYFDWTQLLVAGFSGFAADVSAKVFAGCEGRPVQLVGYSIGGPLAMACAKELEAAGIKVICLVLLDTFADERPRPRSREEQMQTALRRLRELDLASIGASLLARCLLKDQLRPMLLWLAQARRRNPQSLARLSVFHRYVRIRLMQRLFWPWWQSVLGSGYVFRSPAFLFRTDSQPEGVPLDLGWKRLCQDLTVVPVAGSHENILGARGIEVLRSWLDPVLMKDTVKR